LSSVFLSRVKKRRATFFFYETTKLLQPRPDCLVLHTHFP
jgi:hypothetical protein